MHSGLKRFAAFLLATALATLVFLAAQSPATGQAQDEENVGAAAAQPAAGQPGAGQPVPREPLTMLEWCWQALGAFYTITFLGISFTFVALLVMNLLAVRRDVVIPESLVTQFEKHLDAEQYQEAYGLAKTDESFLGHMLEAGLAKVSDGYSHAIEAMQEVGEEESMKMEHRLSYLALIGTLSPMVGLFGTVDGMIRAFSVIANSDSAPPASELAMGVSTALLTTLVGLAIAIPAITAFNILRNHVTRLVLQVGRTSEGLMSRFQKPANA